MRGCSLAPCVSWSSCKSPSLYVWGRVGIPLRAPVIGKHLYSVHESPHVVKKSEDFYQTPVTFCTDLIRWPSPGSRVGVSTNRFESLVHVRNMAERAITFTDCSGRGISIFLNSDVSWQRSTREHIALCMPGQYHRQSKMSGALQEL